MAWRHMPGALIEVPRILDRSGVILVSGIFSSVRGTWGKVCLWAAGCRLGIKSKMSHSIAVPVIRMEVLLPIAFGVIMSG